MRFLFVIIVGWLVVMSGCAPYTYFNTSNDLRQQNSTVYLVDGSTVEGALTVQLETGRVAGNSIQLQTGETTRNIPIGNVLYYKIDSSYYFPKQIDFDSYNIAFRQQLNFTEQQNLLFVKRISGDNSKLNLFELYQSRAQSADGKEHYYYFVSLPKEERLKTWAFGSSRFFPRFEIKMSDIVSDCPELAKKVAKQEKGYTINQISLELMRLDVFKKIIDEYNNCR